MYLFLQPEQLEVSNQMAVYAFPNVPAVTLLASKVPDGLINTLPVLLRIPDALMEAITVLPTFKEIRLASARM